MKKTIRDKVFETNSSSVHSLCISNDGLEQSELKIHKDGKIHVGFGYFGKDYCIYDSQHEKLSYLMTCLCYIFGYDIDNIYESYDFKMIEDAICSYTGAKGIKIIGDENDAYIDHQSIPYDGIEIINIYDDDEIINFVFNKYISLKTDSD